MNDDLWFTMAGDKNRHKVQLYFNFDAQELNKGDTISVKNGLIHQSGNVMNITVDTLDDIEVLVQPLFIGLSLCDLSWRGTPIKIEKKSPTKPQRNVSAGNSTMSVVL
jgi:hypothetical protein